MLLFSVIRQTITSLGRYAFVFGGSSNENQLELLCFCFRWYLWFSDVTYGFSVVRMGFSVRQWNFPKSADFQQICDFPLNPRFSTTSTIISHHSITVFIIQRVQSRYRCITIFQTLTGQNNSTLENDFALKSEACDVKSLYKESH